MTGKNIESRWKTYGKSRSLRLRGFDYSSPRLYFLTICAREGEKPFVNSVLCEGVKRLIKECKERYDFRVYAWCLMPDHLHLLVQPPGDGITISRFVQGLKSMTARLYWELGGAGKLWQRGFYDHILRNDEEPTTVGEYVLNNPFRKGLVESAEEYSYSGIMDDIPS